MAAEKKTLIISLSGASLLIAGVFLFTQLVPINIAANSYLLVQNAQAEAGNPYLVGNATFEEFSGATIDPDFDNRNLLAMAETDSAVDDLPEYMPGEVLVQYKRDSLTVQAVETQASITADQMGLRVLSQDAESGLVHFKKEDADVEALVEELKGNSNVEIAQPNYIYTLQSDYTPWGVGTNGDELGDSGVNADWVWKEGITGDGVVVAVIDSGVDYNHEDLKDNIWQNEDEICDNGIDDDGNNYIDDCIGYDFFEYKDQGSYIIDNNPMDDYAGHGTHVAGIIAALSNNLGIFGVAPKSKIMPVKVFGIYFDGIEYHDSITSYSFITGIEYARENNADIINMSLGGYTYAQLEKDTIDAAINEGIVIIASAGNDYTNQPHYPSGYENVISVSATDIGNDFWLDTCIDRDDNQFSCGSNYGSTIDIAAPGVGITSTVPSSYELPVDGSENPPSGITGSGKYASWSGTSMAAPHVAGVAALLLQQNPNLTPAEVKNILTGSAKDLGTPGRDDFYGYGLVDAYAALFPPKLSVSLHSQEFYPNQNPGLDLVSTEAGDLDVFGSCTLAAWDTTDAPDGERMVFLEPLDSGIYDDCRLSVTDYFGNTTFADIPTLTVVDTNSTPVPTATPNSTPTPNPTTLPIDDSEIPAVNGEIIIWEGTLFAGSKNLLLDSMTFENTGTATNADIDKYTLYKKNSSNSFSPLQQGGGLTPNGDADIDLLEVVRIDAGESMDFVLTVDIADSAAVGKTIIMKATADTTEIIDPTPTPTATPTAVEAGILKTLCRNWLRTRFFRFPEYTIPPVWEYAAHA